jgi:flagellar motor component MotA
MNVPRIVGFVMLITTLMVGIGSNLSSMTDPGSLVLVVGGILGMLLLGRHNIGGMITAVFSDNADETTVRQAIEGYKMGRYYSMAAAAVALGIGSIVVLKNLNDPGSIGPGLAIALLSTLYGLLLGFVLFPGLQSGLENRLPEPVPVDERLVPGALLALVFCTVMTVAVFGVLTASFTAG